MTSLLIPDYFVFMDFLQEKEVSYVKELIADRYLLVTIFINIITTK